MRAHEIEGGTVLASFAVVLLLYIVGIGPAALIYDSCPTPVQKGIELVYTPMEWLDTNIPGEPISKYLELWRSYK